MTYNMFMHILVLYGGESTEREVSLRSGAAVISALRQNGHNVTAYDTRDGLDGIAPLLPGIDVVFPVLHGKGGEDGTVQEIIESHNISFVGTGSEASRLCIDKVASKKLLEDYGIPTPAWEVVDAEGFRESLLSKKPYVLKAIDGGSSIDTLIVRTSTPQPETPQLFDRYKTLLLEELIEGVELTVAILGDEALPVVEIIPPQDMEFDYENKYNGASQELCPPQHISQPLQEQAQSLAEQIHAACGARHLSRVDMMISPKGELYVLEINTIPGLTEESLFPKAAAASGLAMTDLVEKLVKMAAASGKNSY